MQPHPPNTGLRAVLVWTLAAVLALACAGLATAAALVPAPPAAAPFIVVTCIGCALALGRELAAPTQQRDDARPRLRRRDVARLRRQLERLPETKHPLGR